MLRFSTRIPSALLAVALIGCGSSDGDEPAACKPEPELGKTVESTYGTVSFKPDVVFPEDQDGYQGVDAVAGEAGAETLMLRYAGAVPSFSAGEVIVGYQQAPFYFRRVVAVRPVAGGVELDVEAASLTDAVAKADVSAYMPVAEEPDALGPNPVQDGAMYTRGADQGTWTPFDLGDQVWYEKKKSDGSNAVLVKTTPESQLTLDGGYDIRIHVDWDDVYFYAKFHGGYYLNFGLIGELDFQGSETFEKKLYPTGDNEDWKTLGHFSICGIPIQLDFRLEGTAYAEADATGSFGMGYSNRRSYGFWFSMNNGDWDSGTIHTLESDWHQPPNWTLDGTVTLEAGLKPTLALGLGGSFSGVGLGAHAGFNAHPKVRLGAEVHTHTGEASTIDWDLDGCLDLGVHASASASFFGYKKKKEWEKVLWSGCLDFASGSKCIPDCDGKECGSDGCNGICGSSYGDCEDGWVCDEGTCVCVPDCSGKICGGDGCGGECPNGCEAYGSIYECIEGKYENVCACIPDCDGKACGSDGCGGECPNTCGSGEACNASNQCEPISDTCVSDCGARECGRDPVCQRFCPLSSGSDGTCDTGLTCTSAGQCCRVVEEFEGDVGVPYSGELYELAAGPSGSTAQRVTTGLGVLPSAPSALRMIANGDGAITYGRRFDSVTGALVDLPVRRAETMVRVAQGPTEPPQGDMGVAFGFAAGSTVTWGFEFDNLAKIVRLRHGADTTDLGAFENDRWYKLITRANADFSELYLEVVDVGGMWVPVTSDFSTTACTTVMTTQPPHLRCGLASEVYGSVRFIMSAWTPVPQTAYFDDFYVCP